MDNGDTRSVILENLDEDSLKKLMLCNRSLYKEIKEFMISYVVSKITYKDILSVPLYKPLYKYAKKLENEHSGIPRPPALHRTRALRGDDTFDFIMRSIISEGQSRGLNEYQALAEQLYNILPIDLPYILDRVLTLSELISVYRKISV